MNVNKATAHKNSGKKLAKKYCSTNNVLWFNVAWYISCSTTVAISPIQDRSYSRQDLYKKGDRIEQSFRGVMIYYGSMWHGISPSSTTVAIFSYSRQVLFKTEPLQERWPSRREVITHSATGAEDCYERICAI